MAELPSSRCGAITETVGWFNLELDLLSDWLLEDLGAGWRQEDRGFESWDALCLEGASSEQERMVLLPSDGWVALLTAGKYRGDVGLLPSLAARRLGCIGIRATARAAIDDHLGSAILEVFDASSTDDVLACRRNVYAADDGGSWQFGEFGDPFEFENLERYQERRVQDRFTPSMVHSYLKELGVPDRLRLASARVLVGEDPSS